MTQKGSLVDAQRTRFDFAHSQPMTDQEIHTVEALVNRAIRANYPVEVRLLPYDEAIKSGAMALFGEKYGDEVRVLRMGDFSTELCGGTHVGRTGDIGSFKIVSESGVAAGIRRVEAVTAEGALAYTHELEAGLNSAARALKTSPAEVPAKIQQVLEQVRALERELSKLQEQAGVESGCRHRGAGGGSQRRAGARGGDRRRGRQDAARHAGSAQGTVQVSRDRARVDRRSQGDADRRRDVRSDRQDQGG